MFLIIYLSISIGVYIGAAIVNITSFKDADVVSILRGIIGAFVIGALVWSIGMILSYVVIDLFWFVFVRIFR